MAIAGLASLATTGSIFLFVLWYLRSKNAMEERVRSLGVQERLVVEADDPFSQRVAFPMIDGLVNLMMAALPTALIGKARHWLQVTGEKYTISQFLTVVLITSTAIPGGYFVLAWIGSGGSPSTMALLPALFLLIVGIIGPFMVLRRMAKNRQLAIWKSLPNALDLMTTCVEAGLSLDFAMQRVATRYQGPLAEEIQRTIREVGLGKPRREALVDMAERVGLPDLMTFVNSIVQAEALGTSVGQVLRVQAQQMRVRRRQRAEQVARQAPVKMVFPLVLFLMPSLFIVTIGPVVISVMRSFND